MPEIPLVIEKRQELAYIHTLHTESNPISFEPWFIDILNYLTKKEYPPGASTRAQCGLRLLASQYVKYNRIQYKRTPLGVHFLCIDKPNTKTLMDKVYSGICGTHMNKLMLAQKIIHLGYY